MIVALDEIPRAAACDPDLDWRPVRDHLGISAFGVNAFLDATAGHRRLVVGGPPGSHVVSDWEARQLAASRRA